MDQKRERDKALKRARRFAGLKMFRTAQMMIDQAMGFFPVSRRQVQNVQRIYDRAMVGTQEFAGATA